MLALAVTLLRSLNADSAVSAPQARANGWQQGARLA